MRNWVLYSSLLVALMGCSERDEVWDQAVSGQTSVIHAMQSSAAIVDTPGERVIFAMPQTAEQLTFASVQMGIGYQASAPTTDGERLVVLTSGEVPRRHPDDEGPALSVIDTQASPLAVTRYDLADPLSGLVLDPLSQVAVIYSGSASSTFAQNPNELLLVRLDLPPSETNPLPATLRSFGGRPEGFTFTPELALPGGARRLLVVRTDRDIALIDLSAPDKPEITVGLTSGAVAPRPVGIAVTDGEPEDDTDSRIAVRLENDSSILLLDLLPTPPDKVDTSPHSFLPAPNIVDAGGVVTDITFGQTDGGLRLLALVPSKQSLALIDPATGVYTEVALGAAFQRMSIVTDVVGATDDGGDIALLWSTYSPAIAFVALGTTIGKPYKSVEVRTLEQSVGEVLDVPPPNAHLKILASAGNSGFVVLNLLSRTTTPLLTSAYDSRGLVSSDGNRLWLYSETSSALALVGLSDLHPKNLLLEQRVSRLFDLERADSGRALVTLDTAGSMGLTLLDANDPSLATATEYTGILLGSYETGDDQ